MNGEAPELAANSSEADKKNFLIRLLKKKRARDRNDQERDSTEFPEIVADPAGRYDPFPLTEIQHAYWIGRIGAFELGNVGTHIYLEFDLPILDVDRINSAWQRLIDRHDMLRAIIQPDGRQRVLREVKPYRVATLDLRGASNGEAQAHLEENRRLMSHRIYRAEEWPLFDVRAFHLENKRTRYCLSFDLLIVDLLSFQILITEWLQLYQDPQVRLEPLAVTFRDFVLTENAFRKSDQYSRAKEYWWERAPHLPPAPSLPMAKDPRTLSQYRFERRTASLDKQRWQKLKERARLHGLTPTSVLMTAFAEVLTTWGKSPRFTLNLIVFNRPAYHKQINRIVGDFTSIDLLEVDHRVAETFVTRARRLQKQLWTDLEHRHISGIQVLREIARIHGWDRAAMPVVFTCDLVQGTVGEDTFESRFPVDVVYGISQTPQVWLDHQVYERGGSLMVNWDVVEELFPPGLIDEMFAANVRLLERFVEDEKAWQQTTFELTPPAQIKQRAAINATDTPVPKEMLHTLFIAQASQQPEQTAVITNQRTLSYGELLRLSNQLGRKLRSLGATPNKLIAVVMEKGWEQVVAVLGILQAGAPYLPIDPDLPQERQWYLLENGEVTLAVTQSWLDENLEWPNHITRCRIDENLSPESNEPLLDTIQKPNDLAYVIYTSGSTGFPKGVMIDHRGAVNTICDINQRFDVGPSDRILALSALSFDLSVYDIFGVLAAGATIVIPEAYARRDPAHWTHLMTEHQVTVWNSVPALMEMLVEYVAGLGIAFPPLRLIMLSGDWIPVSLPKRINSLVDNVQVISLGGATEASIWSILYPIESVDQFHDSIPYGRPMVNQRFHVLNERLEPSPVWVPGQLYIGGTGLAEGYWRDGEKTESSFFNHPTTGERIYRTGDLGCYLPDGNIKFLGREDTQVKIRGHRIELGEIEAALEQYPGVRNAVAVAVGEERDKKKIAAFVTADNTRPEALFAEVTAPAEDADLRWEVILQAGAKQARDFPFALDVLELVTPLEEVSTLCICQALQELGAFATTDEQHFVESLLSHCQILPRYRKLLAQWLNILREIGVLEERANQKFARVCAWPEQSPDVLWEEIEKQIVLGNEARELFDYARQSGESLTALLTGNVDPLELFFPGGSWQLAESLYELNPAATYVNTIAREIVRAAAAKQATGNQLRILEIGAGTGGTTKFLLPVLPPDQTEYIYSDVSTFFTNQAREKFRDYPFVEYRLLNIDDEPEHQGFEPHSVDLIICANVLHDAENLSFSVQQLRELLAPHGCLLLIEGTRNSRLQMITVGLLEGLSGFKDEREQKNLPFLAKEEWRHILLRNGFRDFAAFPEAVSSAEVLGVHVMLARAPASIKRFKKDELVHHLKERLPSYAIPSDILFLKELRLSSNGKVNRKSLPTLEQTASKRVRGYVAPRGPVEQLLADVWSKVLGVEKVGVHDNFFDLGGDSLIGIQLVTTAHSLGLVLDPRQLFQRQTIAELAPLVEEHQQAGALVENPQPEIEKNHLSCVVRLDSGEANGMPFFCVHPSTGNIDCYLDLSRQLEPTQAIYGIQTPERLASASEPLPEIPEIAANYLKEIRSVQPQGPYFLGGWSMGGVIAFEVAQQLRSLGQDVASLVLLDIGVGDFKSTNTEADDSAFINDLFQQMSVGLPPQKTPSSLRARATKVVERAQVARMLPPGIEKVNLRKYLDISRRHIRALQHYTPSYYAGRITLLKAQERPDDHDRDTTLGWSALAAGGVEVEVVPGNHFSMLREPHIQHVAQHLRSAILAAQERRTQEATQS